MADASWDNSGLPTQKKGMPLWLKALLGCGLLMLLLLGGCVGGCYYLGHLASKDPKGFERSVQGFVGQFIQEDWDDARKVVDQLMTDEGAKALYHSNPGLADAFPNETAFVQAARGWRPKLKPLPPQLPDLNKGDLSFQNSVGDRSTLSYRPEGGSRLRLIWIGSRKKGDRTLVDISVD